MYLTNVEKKVRSSAALEITMNLIISNGSEVNRILISDIDRFKCEKRFAYSNFVRWYREKMVRRVYSLSIWLMRSIQFVISHLQSIIALSGHE